MGIWLLSWGSLHHLQAPYTSYNRELLTLYGHLLHANPFEKQACNTTIPRGNVWLAIIFYSNFRYEWTKGFGWFLEILDEWILPFYSMDQQINMLKMCDISVVNCFMVDISAYIPFYVVYIFVLYLHKLRNFPLESWFLHWPCCHHSNHFL